MNLIQSFATKNPCYKADRSIKIEGIILEGVGCPQSSARVFAHNRNRENCEGKCAHAFVDANDGAVIQLLPWEHRGWHCGKHPRTKKNANDTHIGVQICEPSQIRYKKKNEIELIGDKEKAAHAVTKAYDGAVELCVFLCKKFDLDPMTAVISRKEAYDACIASMQASPEFVWKAVGVEYTMDKLRNEIKQKMTESVYSEIGEMMRAGMEDGLSSITKVDEPSLEEKPGDIGGHHDDPGEPGDPGLMDEPRLQTDDKFNLINGHDYPGHPGEAGEEPKIQMVKITVDNLRIRSTPGVGNNTTGKFTGCGIFAITEIQNGSGSKSGWGKLQSGAGWICLDYVEML